MARPGEFLTEGDLMHLSGGRVWVVDVERWEKEAHAVPIPSTWANEGEWRFPEIYGDGCEIIVRAFMAPPLGIGRERLPDHTPVMNLLVAVSPWPASSACAGESGPFSN